MLSEPDVSGVPKVYLGLEDLVSVRVKEFAISKKAEVSEDATKVLIGDLKNFLTSITVDLVKESRVRHSHLKITEDSIYPGDSYEVSLSLGNSNNTSIPLICTNNEKKRWFRYA